MSESISNVVARVWEELMAELPDPWCSDIFTDKTYRDRLDSPKYNMRGELIPRIVLVRANIRNLGKPRRKPILP